MTRIHLYDTTLRDGAQTQGVDFSLADKKAIAVALDGLGIDYVEAGWPGANPSDSALFADLPPLSHGRFSAFGMTRRPGVRAADDPGLAAVLAPGTPVVCLVGKSWDFHVREALGIGLGENLDMIADSIAHVSASGREALFDAEHFFDGFKDNPGFALDCAKAAAQAGARWIVLCDTNGGTLPHEVERIVGAVADAIGGDRIGIHCHDDTGTGVANSLAAVHAGARQIQGTLNGLGERCGNANLVSLIPTLVLKLGYELGIDVEGLRQLTSVSRLVDERLNRAPNPRAPYVGEHAFAHKGGLHASAVAKDARSYEHVPPETVGNRRHIIVSDQAGRANMLARLHELGVEVDPKDSRVATLVDLVKAREAAGYAYDGAAASFELMARAHLGANFAEHFRVTGFRVIDERWTGPDGKTETLSEVTVDLEIDGVAQIIVARGNGPVDALDGALRKALEPVFPALHGVRLTDYKVRILTPEAGAQAVTRVMIESRDAEDREWRTIGVAENVIDASYRALEDSLKYRLLLM
ncbi:MAG TPA: citramalate synthase [Stellaceae bacterium]|nr:citramalate synthase [Stellaceae bacterium]